MSDPRVTEERLRSYLDSNQVMRERMCLALLPLLGPFTNERPRRPKGGPDQGRDLEAVYQGTTPVWAAIGFRNGGGNDYAARKEAQDKFQEDLQRALEENPTLKAFVFLTNVDLTPGIIDDLKTIATKRGVAFVDVCDMERLRHALDSSEGLIARLQYLGIPMSTTEQIALVNKFGGQLQNAVSARFDRVEKTLSAMEHFLGRQKPINRLDVFLHLKRDCNSKEIGKEALLLEITGMLPRQQVVSCLYVNVDNHPKADAALVLRPVIWTQSQGKATHFLQAFGVGGSLMRGFAEIEFNVAFGGTVRVADLGSVSIDIKMTELLSKIVSRVMLDTNGYELMNCGICNVESTMAVDLDAAAVGFDNPENNWFKRQPIFGRNFLFEPPLLSGRLAPLRLS